MMKTLVIQLLFLMIVISSLSFSQEEYEEGLGEYVDAYPSYYEDSESTEYYNEDYYSEYYEEDVVTTEDSVISEDEVLTTDDPTVSDTVYETETEIVSDTDTGIVEDTPLKSQTNVLIPLFQNYRLPEHINPQDQSLPYTHAIKKLRGTVWRGSEEVFRPNARGVITTQRLFIFFDKQRDAIAYKYISYNSKRNIEFPRMEEFFPLIPLLQTNSFEPITSESLLEISTESILNRGVSSELWVDPAFASDLNEEGYEEGYEGEYEGEYEEGYEGEYEEGYEGEYEEGYEGEYEEGYEGEYEEGYEGEYEEGYEGEYEEGYEGEYEGTVSTLFYLPQTMIAQNIEANSLQLNQYVVNVGGDTSGIFVHETHNPNTPYMVIFLSLDGGMTLYEYNINNSFDVRNTTTQSSQRARELYINILEQKINMKKFQRVNLSTDFTDL